MLSLPNAFITQHLFLNRFFLRWRWERLLGSLEGLAGMRRVIKIHSFHTFQRPRLRMFESRII